MYKIIIFCLFAFVGFFLETTYAFYQNPCINDGKNDIDCYLVNSYSLKIANNLSGDVEKLTILSDRFINAIDKYKDNIRISSVLNHIHGTIMSEIEDVRSFKSEKLFDNGPFLLIHDRVFMNVAVTRIWYRYIPVAKDEITEFSCSSENHCIYKIGSGYYASVGMGGTKLEQLLLDTNTFQRINGHYAKDKNNVRLFYTSYGSDVYRLDGADPELFRTDIELPTHLQNFLMQTIHWSTDGSMFFANWIGLRGLNLQTLHLVEGGDYDFAKFYFDGDQYFMVVTEWERGSMREVVGVTQNDIQKCEKKDAITVLCNGIEINNRIE